MAEMTARIANAVCYCMPRTERLSGTQRLFGNQDTFYRAMKRI